MRKEVLYAVIFGIILRGVILYGIRLANNSANILPMDDEAASVSAQPSQTPVTESFQIITPQNHAVLTEKSISLTGTGLPGTSLAIVTELDDLIIEISPEGSFSAQINLLGGENTITLTNLLSDYTISSQTFTVIQSSTLPE